MNFKITFFLLISSLFLIACNDDDDTKYKWNTKWTKTTTTNAGDTIMHDIVVDNIVYETEDNARASVNSKATTFDLLAVNPIIDEVVDERDYKDRKIVYELGENLVSIRYTMTKLTD